MFKNDRKIIFPWMLVSIWMVFIFSFSAQPASQSNNLSQGITKVIIEIVSEMIPFSVEASTTADIVMQFNHLIRKLAHGGIYFVLGVLVIKALNGVRGLGLKKIIFALVFCIVYAISDEVHQLFVPGRSGQVSDVMIDTIGAALGIIMYVFVNRLKLFKKVA